jgi:hypothetical protein
VLGMTGDCSCEAQWFTFGANPGKVQVEASMRKPNSVLTNEYAIRVMVLQGAITLGYKYALCLTNQKHCAGIMRFSVSVPRHGVYYVRVDGMGAHQIPFALQLKGSVFALHCTKTC